LRKLNPDRAEDIRELAFKDRRDYGYGDTEPIDVYKVITLIEGVTILKTPLNNIAGFYKVIDEAKLIVIDSNSTLARQNFTLAHELYHLKYDDGRKDYDTVEEEADEYASHFLIPKTSLEFEVHKRKKINGKITLADIIFLEQFYGVSHQAFIKRLKEQRLISTSFYEELANVRITAEAKKIGRYSELYEPTKENFKIDTNFIELISKLRDKGKISDGKYNSYLRNNSLWDIVYEEIDDEEFE